MISIYIAIDHRKCHRSDFQRLYATPNAIAAIVTQIKIDPRNCTAVRRRVATDPSMMLTRNGMASPSRCAASTNDRGARSPICVKAFPILPTLNTVARPTQNMSSMISMPAFAIGIARRLSPHGICTKRSRSVRNGARRGRRRRGNDEVMCANAQTN
jgi:hypothetical protein